MQRFHHYKQFESVAAGNAILQRKWVEAVVMERDALATEVRNVTAALAQLQQQIANKSAEPNTASKV